MMLSDAEKATIWC